MDIFKFFKQAKYIKTLEETIKKHEGEAERRHCDIAKLNQELATERILRENAQKEISELKKTPPEPKLASNIDISDPIFQKMIKAGRNVLVKKAHPDHGGGREEFEKVEKAYEMLKTLKIQPKQAHYNNGFGGLGQQAAMYEAMAAQQDMYRRYRNIYGL